jgi:hypothetical protein
MPPESAPRPVPPTPADRPPHRPDDRCPPGYYASGQGPHQGPSVGQVLVVGGVVAFQVWVLYRVLRMSSQTNQMYQALAGPK